MKFMKTRPDVAEYVRNSPTPREALRNATHYRGQQRKDWLHVNISKMDEVLSLKFAPGTELANVLLQTRDREIIEDSPVGYPPRSLDPLTEVALGRLFLGCGQRPQRKK
jgi:predicted NAD-dependent protein-ADP-ribosyltransferase YbiA (DUF1768 family)